MNKGRIDFNRNQNLQYYVSCDYDYEYDCEENGCDEICRCGRIVDATVRPTRVGTAINFAKISFKDGQGDEGILGFALAVRFFKNAFCNDMFDIAVEYSYYGEEISGVYANTDSLWGEFDDRVEAFNQGSNSERLKLVLEMEYGNLLPEVAKYDKWELKEIPVTSVHVNEEKMGKLFGDVTYQYQSLTPWYYSKADSKVGKGWFPAVVVIPRDDGKYRLIDGFHRWSVWTTKPYGVNEKTWKRMLVNKKIKVIVPVE